MMPCMFEILVSDQSFPPSGALAITMVMVSYGADSMDMLIC